MENNLWQDLYHNHADRYDRLVRAEDYQGNLIAALRDLNPPGNGEVVEFGAGTGRITAQLCPYVKHICAFDLTPAMISLAHRKLRQSGSMNWSLMNADSRAVPLPTNSADLALEGWSFIQIMSWHKLNWQEEVGRAIQEMLRVVRPGGVVILIETLGTGETEPHPPAAFEVAYDYFEREWQFFTTWIRTDYCFSTTEELHNVVSPVFGDTMLERTYTSEAGIILPECTGIWWRSV
jgi:ubiquinone/menaquinone biosynthesis C-methylase UbiE